MFLEMPSRFAISNLYVELPFYLSRYTNLLDNANAIQSQMSIAAEAKMTVRRFENIPNLFAWGGTTSTLMYEVHLSLILGGETDPSMGAS